MEEEDEDSFTYSVRISSQDLLLVSPSKLAGEISNLVLLMLRCPVKERSN